MNMALQQLKALLLSKSLQTFDVEHGRSIVNTLQSLLKVAEMRSKCCFMEDCAHPTLAQKNKFSVNISPKDDQLLTLSVRGGPQRDFISADFDGQSDEETASDNSFDTAEEGYEVTWFAGVLFFTKYVLTYRCERFRETPSWLGSPTPTWNPIGLNRRRSPLHRLETTSSMRESAKWSSIF